MRSSVAAFRRTVWTHYEASGRHALPWRKTRDPYRILVSEVMLQQTQVERVIPYYAAWLKLFPTAEALARAPLSKVLRAWQGLGYNRRAKNLHAAVKAVMKEYGGKFPKALEALPGVGPYTANAVRAFARNEDVIFIETNIRTAVIHHFFTGAGKSRRPIIYDRALEKVEDADIAQLLEKALPKGKAREWYSALMDYGSFLKRSGVRLNAQAKGYTKQSTFKGSAREARGAILKALAKGPRDSGFLTEILGEKRRMQVKSQLASLTKEGMIELSRGRFRLPR